MSVNTYLKELSSNLVLSSDENEKIKISISNLEDKLKNYFGDAVTENFRFGSSTRGTILPRKVDENSDIDYMIVFDNSDNLKPQTYLDKIKKFVEKYYTKSEIHQSSPTIVLNLNHIKFELVPAYKYGTAYYISNGNGNWMYTNPNDFNDTLTHANILNDSKLKPIIRLIKYWNITYCNRYYDSYNLEKKITNDLKYAYTNCSNFSDYVLNAFSSLKSSLTFGSPQYNKIQKSIDKLKEAIEDEIKYPSLYLDEIKEIFPEI